MKTLGRPANIVRASASTTIGPRQDASTYSTGPRVVAEAEAGAHDHRVLLRQDAVEALAGTGRIDPRRHHLEDVPLDGRRRLRPRTDRHQPRTRAHRPACGELRRANLAWRPCDDGHVAGRVLVRVRRARGDPVRDVRRLE
jgi:hypothetical protein